MRIHALLPRQSDNCVPCGAPPVCSCPADQDCVLINRDCQTCATIQCVPKSTNSSGSKSGGVSKGALAGAIIGVLIFLGITVALLLWYRKRSRLNRAAQAPEAKREVPAAAVDVLSRPDPNEEKSRPPTELNTVRVYSTSSDTTIDLDPQSQHRSSQHATSHRSSTQSNPFSDGHSIKTGVTEGTNVIPIALVSPDREGSLHTEESSTSSGPVRPPRSPELNLNLDHVNVSNESIRPANYALSQRSGLSGISATSSRNSYMSSASYASEFLNEAPIIMTANKTAVRVVKAEGLSANPSPTTQERLRPPTLTAKPSVRSPLAKQSFTPGDASSIASEESHEGNPFSDKHSSNVATVATSPAPSNTTFGAAASRDSHVSAQSSEFSPETPIVPWAKRDDDASRPTSISTQAGSVIGSVIDIGSATRVNVGLGVRSPFRTTMGKLVTPSTAGVETLQEQQQRALAHAQAQALAQGQGRRISASSIMTSASATADSILESFPFVPPSPISNRPLRSPPVSPLAQQSFTTSAPPTPALSTFSNKSAAPTQEQPVQVSIEEAEDEDDVGQELLIPPNRKTLGMSTASQLSTASTGLGSFPFQIESARTSDLPLPDSATFPGRQRASLDTLAITADLSSYPLGYDKAATPNKKN